MGTSNNTEARITNPPETAIGKARVTTGIEIPSLLTLTEVSAWLGLTRAMIKKVTKESGFPEPLEISPRVRRYRRDQIEAWIEAMTPPKKAKA